MDVGRTASPSSSIDDLTLGSSSLPNGHRDQRRDSSTNSVLVTLYKDDPASEKGSGDGQEVVSASQTTADILAKFTESGDEPSNSTNDGALSLTTKPISSTIDALTTAPASNGETAANLIPSGHNSASEVNEMVPELAANLGDAPSPAVLVSTSDDPPSSVAQTDLPPMAEVVLDPELSITSERLIGPSRSSQGTIIAVPGPTELTVLTEDSSTNPPVIVRDVTNADSTPPLRVPRNSTRAEITETPVGGMAPDLNTDHQAPPLISESRGPELTTVVTLGPTVEGTPDTTSRSTLSLRVPSNSTLAETTKTPVSGITPDPNPGDPLPLIPESRGSGSAMVVALSPIVEETPETTSGNSIGTGDHAPPTKPMHDNSQIPNIIFFGETGAGKSSVINMLMNSDTAGTSSTADGKTSSFESFVTFIDGQRVRLWDTAGLSEAEGGTVPAKVAMQNLRALVGALRDGIALLVYCVQATRFRPNLKDNYDLVHGTICQGKVPIFIVITGLENQVPMDAWWAENEAEFSQNGMSFDGHACVTSTKGKQKEDGYMYDEEFQESQRVLRKLTKDYFATPRSIWTIENNKIWELETSSKIDSHFDGKNQGVETNVVVSDGFPTPPRTQTWWEYVRSFL